VNLKVEKGGGGVQREGEEDETSLRGGKTSLLNLKEKGSKDRKMILNEKRCR